MYRRASSLFITVCTSIPTGAVAILGCIAFLAIFAFAHQF